MVCVTSQGLLVVASIGVLSLTDCLGWYVALTAASHLEEWLLKQLLPQVKAFAQDPVADALPGVWHTAALSLCRLKGALPEGGQRTRPWGCSQGHGLCKQHNSIKCKPGSVEADVATT